ncbi:tetraspanin Tsp2 [Lentinus tigrinus ALCF2SS1-7]|uniref:Tetraspanin Tsp2 n=1 Tax=Lentinus tigrinus ALCF2SS1-6 TaxID=1328759 RepID=A0A5C2RT19_9APHY|nr:tetraspanin Tsp2 [Lentinus tigrinus ALCF2SS1-6]RPD69357.1 tetraspanin Tsp2 [Lentinus tigrinus ALCF2SS1-7]
MDRSPSHSRSSSINSHSPSVQSHAASTRYMLAGMNNNSSGLDPPNLPYSSSNSFRSMSPKNDTPLMDSKGIPTSLSVNYLPSKFSSHVLTGGMKRRKGKGAGDIPIPKRGGGREAFRANESRMPGDGDDDYDGVTFGQGARKGRLRWTGFKWVLFISNLVFSIYSITGLIATLLIHFNVWTHADIIRVGNKTELIISTVVAALGVLTSLIGWSGILLNNRAFLAVYSFLLWICFALLVTPGYITYKKRTFNLEGKMNAQWSRDLGLDGRLRIQNQLHCCGYFNPFIEATVSQTCYARSLLPGCKGPYIEFQRQILERWYTVVFSLVPAQIAAMVIALLCSNHVTYRFGKGMMPKAYRLNMNSMAVIMDNYANQLAEQYGNDVASEVMARSRSNLQLDAMPTMPYSNSSSSSFTGKYDQLGNK